MAESKFDIADSFKQYNIDLDEKALNKCFELSLSYNLPAEEFVEEWLSYTVSHLNRAPPTLENIEKMERLHLTKLLHSKPKPTIEVEEPVYETFQPAPIINSPSQHFTARDDSKTIQLTFGAPKVTGDNTTDPIINWSEIKEKFGFEDMIKRARSIENLTLNLAGEITKRLGIELSTNSIRSNPSCQTVIAGRIYPENPGEKLKHTNLIMETTDLYHQGLVVHLKFREQIKYSLFPGQVVVVEGNNMKNTLYVDKIHYEAPAFNENEAPVNNSGTTNIIIASGPFTLPGNLLYEPLRDLIKLIKENEPNVVLLLGPFVEESHEVFQTMNERFDVFFNNLIGNLMDELPSNIQVLLIPSEKDIQSFPVFPNLPYCIKNAPPNLKLLPNPTIIDINGFKIGAISTDILIHLSKHEISTFTSNRMIRMASHILNQRSFYPLHPSDPEISINYPFLEKYGMIDVKLDLLILPSSLRHFVQNINETIVINPEKLCKFGVAGTYADVQIRGGNEPVSNRISCQIVKI